ncbi:hypothetical protein ACJJTC_018783 [Scirpophaga incertulas]
MAEPKLDKLIKKRSCIKSKLTIFTRVKVQDCNGVEHVARVLLDNGSTANFVTASLCSKLGLSRRSASTTVTAKPVLRSPGEPRWDGRRGDGARHSSHSCLAYGRHRLLSLFL